MMKAATRAHGKWSPRVLGSTERCGRPDDILPAMRFFNTEGPVVAEDHYCIPPLERIDHAEVLELIRRRRYFVLHAPRQTGKTSALLALRDLLEAGGAGDYRCVYVNVEAAQAVREDVERAMRVILGEMGDSALFQGDGFLDGIWSDILARFGDGALGAALTRWCRADPKPLVLLIDEIDTLIGDTLSRGAAPAPGRFTFGAPGASRRAWCCAGWRDVRDYRIHSSTERAVVTGRQRVQHPGRVVAPGGLHRGGGARPGRPAHRGDRAGVHRRGAGDGVEADAGPAMAGQCAVRPRMLRGQGGAGPLAGHHRGGGDGRARASRAESSGPSRPARRQAPGRSGCAAWSSRC